MRNPFQLTAFYDGLVRQNNQKKTITYVYHKEAKKQPPFSARIPRLTMQKRTDIPVYTGNTLYYD